MQGLTLAAIIAAKDTDFTRRKIMTKSLAREM